MKIEAEVKTHARFKITVRKASTNEVTKETGWFDNHVLDAGLKQMVLGDWINRCCVGTGSSEPTDGQTHLDNFIASTTQVASGVPDTGGIQVATVPYYWFGRRTWRFAVGVATGNLSELGMGWGDTYLWNRALIKDINGNPTTITVLSDEYVDVQSEVRVYPADNITGTFNVIDKFGAIVSTHNYLARPVIKTLGTGGSGAFWRATNVTFKAGSDYYVHRVTPEAMVNDVTTPPNEYARAAPTASTTSNSTVTTTRKWESTEAIFSHRTFHCVLNGLMCAGSGEGARANACAYKWEITPPIVKTDKMILTYTWSLTVGRYT